MQKFIIWTCFVISLLWAISHQFLLLIPAPSEVFYNLGMLFQAISLSYIAAFLFYLVHNYLPEKEFKKKVEPMVNEELSTLWSICNDFSYQMRRYSEINVFETHPLNLESMVPKQIKNLLVLPGTYHQKNGPIPKNSHRIPPDINNKPIMLQNKQFDYWSTASQFVMTETDKRIALLLTLKESIDTETIIKLSLMQNAIKNFNLIANTYEENNVHKTFDNLFIQKDMINFYEGYIHLKKYYKLQNPHHK
ncbi:hypothetical protein [Bacillus cereus]|uniref:hypothetical protein n=1 Tax=Bacillus cereus TaxID=1396 RepID=UPI0013753731|nr:hypothetical protein [Bacillus cereus]HEF1906372.1 hypothetical protein [Bacillus cereus]